MSGSESWRNPPPAPELAGFGSRIPPRSLIPDWFLAWWPALLWAVFIFTGSTDTFSSEHTSRIIEPFLRWLIPSITVAHLQFAHHIIRKSAHFLEYFIFFLLLYRGLRGIRRGWHLAPALGAWLIAGAYAVLDEVHQAFIASRGAGGWDSLLDSISAFVALVVALLYYRLRRRHTN